MTFFTVADLAEMRQMQLDAMDCVCDVQPATVVRGPGGTSTTSYAMGTLYPCWLGQSGAAAQMLTADQFRAVARWVVGLPAGTPVPENAQLVVTGVDAHGVPFTLTLRVVGVAGPVSVETVRKVNALLVS